MNLAKLNERLLQSDKPIVTSIMKPDNTKLIAIRLNSGVILKEHTAPGRTKLIVIQGKIKFITTKETMTINIDSESNYNNLI
jgi:quercetin dioxygenase-like cupin family protein